MRQIRTSGSMSEGGKRDYGRIEAPPRCESRRTQLLPDPTVTAPVLDSTARELDRLSSMRAHHLAHDSHPVPAALSEVQPPFVVVVPPASQLHLVDTRLATKSGRVQVMELDEPALVAAMA